MASKGMNALQGWCKTHTEGYRDVKVTNMTTSWKDGLAFCALLNRFRPDLINFESLSKENALYNNELAFSIAEKELNIAALLDAEDMVNMAVPDKLSVMTYLSQYYSCFRNCKPDEISIHELLNPKTKNRSPSEQTNGRIRTLSKNTPSEDSTCTLCGNHVHLVQRYFDNGKLYHRACHRKNSLERIQGKKFFKPSDQMLEKTPEDKKSAETLKTEEICSEVSAYKAKSDSMAQLSVEAEFKPDEDAVAEIRATLSPPVEDNKAVQNESQRTMPPPSPKPRARTIHLQNQTPEKQQIGTENVTYPVATPRSRGNSGATKEKVKDDLSTKNYDKALNPFEFCCSETDTTLSSTSSDDDQCMNPFENVDAGDKETEMNGSISLDEPSGVPNVNGRNSSSGNSEDEESECKNPFGNSENEETEELKSTNPFGDVSDEDENGSVESLDEEPKNPFGEYEEDEPKKLPPARPKPPVRVNPFSTRNEENILQTNEATVKEIKKKRPAPAPPKAVPAPPRPPSWKDRAELDMMKLNKANEDNPKYTAIRMKKAPAPPPPHRSPAKTPPTTIGKDKLKPKPVSNPLKHMRSTRSAPGYGYPLIKRKVERKMSEEAISNELRVLDVQLSDLEVKGVKLEGMLRFTMEKDMEWTSEEDELLQEWFELVDKKNNLLRMETDLVFLMQQQKLEQEHADIEFQLRKLFNKPDSNKTDQDKHEEEELLRKLVEVVERRNVIINSIEEERLKEAEEDLAYEKMKMLHDNPNKKKKKKRVKKMFSKKGQNDK